MACPVFETWSKRQSNTVTVTLRFLYARSSLHNLTGPNCDSPDLEANRLEVGVFPDSCSVLRDDTTHVATLWAPPIKYRAPLKFRPCDICSGRSLLIYELWGRGRCFLLLPENMKNRLCLPLHLIELKWVMPSSSPRKNNTIADHVMVQVGISHSSAWWRKNIKKASIRNPFRGKESIGVSIKNKHSNSWSSINRPHEMLVRTRETRSDSALMFDVLGFITDYRERMPKV